MVAERRRQQRTGIIGRGGGKHAGRVALLDHLARAMILRPKVVVLDEPTSALDMTVQVQIVDLLRDLQRKYGLAFLFISHDLRVVRAMAHHIMVMRAGEVVEQGSVAQIFDAPQHDYTRALLTAAFPIAPLDAAVPQR